MIELSNQQLNNINGGAFKLTFSKSVLIGSAITFLIGLLDGILRPLPCER